MDNKSGSFLLSGVIASIQTKMPAKRGISSSNFVVIRSEYFQFSNPQKNTKNRSSYLKFFVVAVWIYIYLDIKYLRIWNDRSV